MYKNANNANSHGFAAGAPAPLKAALGINDFAKVSNNGKVTDAIST